MAEFVLEPCRLGNRVASCQAALGDLRVLQADEIRTRVASQSLDHVAKENTGSKLSRAYSSQRCKAMGSSTTCLVTSVLYRSMWMVGLYAEPSSLKHSRLADGCSVSSNMLSA